MKKFFLGLMLISVFSAPSYAGMLKANICLISGPGPESATEIDYCLSVNMRSAIPLRKSRNYSRCKKVTNDIELRRFSNTCMNSLRRINKLAGGVFEFKGTPEYVIATW